MNKQDDVLIMLEKYANAPPAVHGERPHPAHRSRQKVRLPMAAGESDSKHILNIPTLSYRSLCIRHSLWKEANINISKHPHFRGFASLINPLFCPQC